MNKIGEKILNLIKKLYPINRSLTGPGNLETLKMIKNIIPNLKILKFKSGKKVFDWKIPPEWSVKSAYIIDPSGKKIADFKKNNLHLLGYSRSINLSIKLDDLKKNIFTLPKQPNAVPYVTSYYKKNWGFCLSYNQLKKLSKGNYKVVIDTNFKKNGNLIVGEFLIRGKSKKEIIISTNICHPSMVNNELSGPCLATFLAEYLDTKKNYYTYRFIFVPETVGMLAYLSKRLRIIKKNFKAGYHLTCIGDKGPFSMIKTVNEDSYSDKIASTVLSFYKNSKKYSFLSRGSDERQYNSPKINLSVATLMRTKFNSYEEYHTSLDNLKIVSKKSLEDSFNYVLRILDFIENDFRIQSTVKGEPFYSKRNLFRKLGLKTELDKYEWDLFNLPAYADGRYLSDICNKIKRPPWELYKTIKILQKSNLLKLSR